MVEVSADCRLVRHVLSAPRHLEACQAGAGPCRGQGPPGTGQQAPLTVLRRVIPSVDRAVSNHRRNRLIEGKSTPDRPSASIITASGCGWNECWRKPPHRAVNRTGAMGFLRDGKRTGNLAHT